MLRIFLSIMFAALPINITFVVSFIPVDTTFVALSVHITFVALPVSIMFPALPTNITFVMSFINKENLAFWICKTPKDYVEAIKRARQEVSELPVATLGGPQLPPPNVEGFPPPPEIAPPPDDFRPAAQPHGPPPNVEGPCGPSPLAVCTSVPGPSASNAQTVHVNMPINVGSAITLEDRLERIESQLARLTAQVAKIEELLVDKVRWHAQFYQ